MDYLFQLLYFSNLKFPTNNSLWYLCGYALSCNIVLLGLLCLLFIYFTITEEWKFHGFLFWSFLNNNLHPMVKSSVNICHSPTSIPMRSLENNHRMGLQTHETFYVMDMYPNTIYSLVLIIIPPNCGDSAPVSIMSWGFQHFLPLVYIYTGEHLQLCERLGRLTQAYLLS